MQKVNILRKKYPEFIYKNYSWKIIGKDLELSFDFSIPPDIKFRPKIIIKKAGSPAEALAKMRDGLLENLVFNLGVIELLSYWKTTCSPKIIIEAGYLNKEQINWWKDLINRGMAQFFYENKINFTKPNFLKISSRNNNRLQKYERKLSNNVMVPLGGGKDSIVTLELLKKTKKDIACFSLNLTGVAKKIMKIGKCKNPNIVQRKIDKKLLELNQKSFLNGHTPFSAYLAFLSSLLAVIFNTKYVAFSNERSSNEGNVEYLGKNINHQYSKSFDFEQKFRDYSKKYLVKDLEYFSFLRPLYEIQIAKLFSQYPEYFDIFLSCNEALKTYSGTKKPSGKWCGQCPKCLFVFMILYPFVKLDKLIKIFNQNLFNKKELLPLMLELIGERKFKPFECVGTKKESLTALYLSWENWKKSTLRHFPIRTNRKMPVLIRYFQDKILPKYPNIETETKKIMGLWDNQNNLPGEFKEVLKRVASY